jgi:hypothetical protein
MNPGHRDQTVGGLQGGEIERRPRVEPVNGVAGLDLRA